MEKEKEGKASLLGGLLERFDSKIWSLAICHWEIHKTNALC